jgi:RNA-directed DNA polymerase
MSAGQYHVVDADIVRYFEEIPHGDLLKSVARRIADGKVLRLVKLWLKSPVEERERSGRWRRTGGRKQKRGIPQGGVISPLLANVYINRVLRHWRETGMSQRLGGIVSYADDFVILCRSHRQARRSLEVITAWLTKVGLTIHPDKTRVCDAWEEPFDFLGYTFGVRRRFPTGTRFLAPVPSKKAQKRLKDRVKALLYRGNPTPWPELREALNRQIAGWANYFSFGWTGHADAAIHWHVAQQARRFLRKRHKLPRGSGRFSRVEVYGPGVGILEIWRYRKRVASRTPSGEASP